MLGSRRWCVWFSYVHIVYEIKQFRLIWFVGCNLKQYFFFSVSLSCLEYSVLSSCSMLLLLWFSLCCNHLTIRVRFCVQMNIESTFQHRKPIKENSKANSKKCLMENYFKWKSNNMCAYSLYAVRRLMIAALTKPKQHQTTTYRRCVVEHSHSHRVPHTNHQALVFHGYWALLLLQLPIVSSHTRNYSSTHYYYYY